MKLNEFLAIPGRTQSDFARQMGVSQGLVGQWLSGRTRITAERALQIQRATEGAVTAAELRPDIFGKPTKRGAAA